MTSRLKDQSHAVQLIRLIDRDNLSRHPLHHLNRTPMRVSVTAPSSGDEPRRSPSG
jgi:hypothetical protein